MRRVTRNYTIRVNAGVGVRVRVVLRHGGRLIMFTAKVTMQGGYPYVKIPKAVRERKFK